MILAEEHYVIFLESLFVVTNFRPIIFTTKLMIFLIISQPIANIDFKKSTKLVRHYRVDLYL